MGRLFERNDKDKPEVLRELLWENEKKANKFMAKVLLFFAACYVIAYIVNRVSVVWAYDPIGDHVYASGFMILTASGVLILSLKGEGKYSRFFMQVIALYAAFAIAVFNVYGLWVTLLLPVIVSCRYYDGKFTIAIGILSVIASIIYMPVALWFGRYEGYLELNMLPFEEGTHFVVEGGLVNSMLDQGLITHEMLKEYGINQLILQIMVMLGVAYISYIVAKNGSDGMKKAADMLSLLHAEDIEAEALKTKITISQIQPHFLYNSLSAIMAIDGNPPQTVDSIADFGKYLRENLNALTEEGNNPFEKELSHVERYVSLEKLRFGDRINVEYDIKEMDFEVPPLSVQMMVENAIKHGLTKKRTPGTVWVSTEKKDGFYIVRVKDDGVGFDTEKLITAEHVGVGSVKKRVAAIPGASIDIKSKIGEGTECTIKVPAQG